MDFDHMLVHVDNVDNVHHPATVDEEPDNELTKNLNTMALQCCHFSDVGKGMQRWQFRQWCV